MDPTKSCEKLLLYVRESNLNFSIKESPFSAFISIRKTYIKNKNGVSLGVFPLQARSSETDLANLAEKNRILVEENSNLKAVFSKNVEISEALENTIHKKVTELEEISTKYNENLERSALTEEKLFDSQTKVDELKVTVSHMKKENENLRNSLNAAKKSLKKNEKEIDTLSFKNENLTENFRKSKSETEILKMERNKLLKEKSKFERKSLKNRNTSTKSTSTQTCTLLTMSTNTLILYSTKSTNTAVSTHSVQHPQTPRHLQLLQQPII